MSSDNGILIVQTGDDDYEVTEWFGEGENYSPLGTYPTLEAAINYAQTQHTEYGLSFVLKPTGEEHHDRREMETGLCGCRKHAPDPNCKRPGHSAASLERTFKCDVDESGGMA
jgi:hypothetical protein